MDEPILDVVIPAFRARYLATTLESLALQEDRHLRVWVGDDASPEDLGRICASYASRMEIRYHRFSENLGARDLCAHWTRCVELGDAPWVWLFSDDDVASPGCVGALRNALAGGSVLARLDLHMIGAQGEVLDIPPIADAWESRAMFLWQRLKRRRESFAVEYGFRRDAWKARGGFVNLPAAWCADDATWWQLAGSDGIRRAQGGTVSWRWSGSNISASHNRDSEKLQACLSFLETIGAKGILELQSTLGLGSGVVEHEAISWLRFHLSGLRVCIGFEETKEVERRMALILGASAKGLGRELRRRNLRLFVQRIRGKWKGM